MPEIGLKDAVNRIFQIVDQRARRKLPSPFFFIVGAGVSTPPLPLARDIADDCRRTAEQYNQTVSSSGVSAMDSYSSWLRAAYPSPEELQNYLRDLLEKKPISKANLRLAHLLLDRRVANTVFTPNFDDLLAKALSLFGHQPLVCDHPLTASRIAVQHDDLQIAHVHGSYWFYDLCNTSSEITDRSRDASMAAALDRWLHDHSPLVVGYSGWEGDVLMSALKRRLTSGRLGTPIFWFCFRRDAIAAVPEWLRKSTDESNIYFVLPEEPAQVATSSQAKSTSVSSSIGLERSEGLLPGDSLSKGKLPSLSAVDVFDALIQRFDLAVPPLTRNPLNFYASGLQSQLGVSDGDDVGIDIYSFSTVIRRIELAEKLLDEKERKVTLDPLQVLRDAISRADYRGAIASAGQLNFDSLLQNSLKEAASLLFEAAATLNDNSKEELAGYRLAVRAAEKIDSELATQSLIAQALFNGGTVLRETGRIDEAIAAYDEIVRRFGDSTESILLEPVAWALLNKGIALGMLGNGLEEIAVYDEVARRFSDSVETALQWQVAKALINKGIALGELRRPQDEIAVYDDVIRRFGPSKETTLLQHVAAALRNKGITLGELGKTEEGIASYDELARRFGDSADLNLQEQVAWALVNKGTAFEALAKSQQALAVFDELLRRFGSSSQPSLQQQIAWAMASKGYDFDQLGQSEDTIAVCDQLLHRFGGPQESAFQGQIAWALVSKSSALMKLNRNDEAIAGFDQVLYRFGDSTDVGLEEPLARALLYQGVAYESRGEKERAMTNYRQLIARFGHLSESDLAPLVHEAEQKLNSFA